jgi:hypothetical protein
MSQDAEVVNSILWNITPTDGEVGPLRGHPAQRLPRHHQPQLVTEDRSLQDRPPYIGSMEAGGADHPLREQCDDLRLRHRQQPGHSGNRRCFTRNNFSQLFAGAIYIWESSLRLIDSVIEDNTGDWCGGIGVAFAANLRMSGCRIADNHSYPGGGGVIVYSRSDIANCSFSGNTSRTGGGGLLYLSAESSDLRNCVITGNQTAEYGGGILTEDSKNLRIRNCIIAANQAGTRIPGEISGGDHALSVSAAGGGIACIDAGQPLIENCTISGNLAQKEGGGVYCESDAIPIFRNCILWGDRPEEVVSHGLRQRSPEFTYCDLQGGFPGEGNIDQDPHLLSLGGFDWLPNPIDGWRGDTFVPRSPRIDAGDPLLKDGISDWHPLCGPPPTGTVPAPISAPTAVRETGAGSADTDHSSASRCRQTRPNRVERLPTRPPGR